MSTKHAQLSRVFKLYCLLHFILTLISIAGTLYLVFALSKTQNELRELQERQCNARCDLLMRSKSETKDLLTTDGNSFNARYNQSDWEKHAFEKRARRQTHDSHSTNETCVNMIRDFMKLLEMANKMLPNKTNANISKSAICLPGPPGPKGVKGDRGARGRRGYDGAKGERGPPGPKGDDMMKPTQDPPKIIAHPQKSILVSDGDSLTLNCASTGHPPPTVTWTKENSTLPVKRKFIERGQDVQMEFRNVSYEQKGKYSCTARNLLGMETFDVDVIFKVRPKRLPSQETVAYEGTSIILRCPVDSYPAPKVRWIRPGYPPFFAQDIHVSHANNTLNIKHVTAKCAGIYLCEASNRFGSTINALSVKVRKEVGPKFKKKLASSKEVYHGQKVQINCAAMGDPIPHVTWTKYEKQQADTQETRAELVIESFNQSNEGIYTCTARNALGSEIVASITLKLIRCPSLASPPNGHVMSLNKGSDDVMVFSCERGYRLTGPEIRVCQRNATWTGEETYCIGDTLRKEGSLILAGKGEYREILSTFLKPVQKSWISEWKLCYRASRDGWSAVNFHGTCGNKESTVTIIKVGLNVFGGYSNQKFGLPVYEEHNRYGYRRQQSRRDCYQSTESFIFSLKNEHDIPAFKSRPYRNYEDAICADLNKGAVFSRDLSISDFARSNNDSSSSLGYTYKPPEGYSYGEMKTNSLLAGRASFTPDEIEVYFQDE